MLASISSRIPSSTNGSRRWASRFWATRGGVAGRLDVREQDAELVAAEAGDRVGVAQGALQPRGDLLQQQVAHVVPERVVDLLEVVEIHDHDHGGVAVAAAGADGLVDPVAEQLAVRQAR